MARKVKPVSGTGLARFRNKLRGGSGLRVLSEARSLLGASDFDSALVWLRAFRKDLLHENTIRTITSLPRGPLFSRASPAREIAWAAARLRQEAATIAVFIELRAEYELALLAGQYEACSSVLDAIESHYGASMWVIENRFVVLQKGQGGLIAQKQYAESIITVRPAGDLVSFLVHFISQRNEDSSTAHRFVQRTRAHLDGTWVPQGLRYYLRWRLTDDPPPSQDAVAEVLNVEEAFAIVDYYETFLALAQHAVAGSAPEVAGMFAQEVARLEPLVNDVRLKKTRFAASDDSMTLNDALLNLVAPNDALLKSDSLKALEDSSDVSTMRGDDSFAWIVAAIAHADIGKEPANDLSLRSEIIRGYYEAIAKEKPTVDVQNRMYKIRLNNRLCSFPAAIDAQTWYETSSEPEPIQSAALLDFMKSRYLTPDVLRYLSGTSNYQNLLLSRYGPCATVLASIAVIEPIQNENSLWSHDQSNFIKLQYAYGAGDFVMSLALAKELQAKTAGRMNRLAARYEAHCLLELSRFDDAIDFIVNRGLTDTNAFEMMPVTTAAAYLEKLDNRLAVASRLSVPILLAEASLYDMDRYASLRNYAYEDFLFAHDVERPSQLRSIEGHFNRSQLVHYLRYICVPEVMENSLVFESSADVASERLAVCSLLADIDYVNAATYESEARDIARAETIRTAVRRAEQSKISADLPALRRWAEKAIKEDYVRLQALMQHHPTSRPIVTAEVLQEVLSGEVPKAFLHLPTDETFALLVELVSLVIRESTRNSEFGLACYLSMRIRHGTLSGQLRGPLERQNIITQRRSGSFEYDSNEYWRGPLEAVDSSKWNAVDTRLARFSQEFDRLVDDFKDEVVQIRSESKPLGLFTVTIDRVRLQLLFAHLNQTIPFEDFIEACFLLFWESVEHSLQLIRVYIDDGLKPRITDLFLALESDIEGIGFGYHTADLDRAIKTALTDAQYALSRVKDWFQVPKAIEDVPLTVEQVIAIGLATVQGLHSSFNPYLTSHVEDLRLQIGSEVLTDALFIIFDNIQKHSALLRPDILVEATRIEDHLLIRVENSLSAGVDNEEARRKVEQTRQSISNDDYQQTVSTEGGSGFSKLRRLMGHESGPVRRLKFGFLAEARFFVELQIRLLEAPHANSYR